MLEGLFDGSGRKGDGKRGFENCVGKGEQEMEETKSQLFYFLPSSNDCIGVFIDLVSKVASCI